jgi:hypothetical protein
MKAILINVIDETVRQVEVENIKDIYKHLDCQTFEVAHNFHDHMDSVYVDEEGLFTMNSESKFFTVKGGHQPFIGNGLVMGLNPMNGESVDHHISVDDLRSRVKFHTMAEVSRMV